MPRNPLLTCITFQCSKSLKKELNNIAIKEMRSLASQLKIIINDWLKMKSGETNERL